MSGVREPLSTYAIVQTGSKQYRVQAGDSIRVESLPVYTGEIVSIDDVLMVSRDGDVKVGTPVVDGARVRAQVTSKGRGRKITVFKYKSKVRYRRTKGHRQHYTDLRIIDISMDGESLDAVEEQAEPVEEVEETVDIVESDVAEDAEADVEEPADETEEDATVAEDDATDDIADKSEGRCRMTMRRSPKTIPSGWRRRTDDTSDVAEDEDNAPVAEDDPADARSDAEDTPGRIDRRAGIRCGAGRYGRSEGEEGWRIRRAAAARETAETARASGWA